MRDTAEILKNYDKNEQIRGEICPSGVCAGRRQIEEHTLCTGFGDKALIKINIQWNAKNQKEKQ